MSRPKLTFSLEKQAIENAIAHAHRKIEISDWCSRDPNIEKMYNEALDELEDLFDAYPEGPPSANAPITEILDDFNELKPKPHHNPEFDAIIQKQYTNLCSERMDYFHEVRRNLYSRIGLKKHVIEYLHLMGLNAVSRHIE